MTISEIRSKTESQLRPVLGQTPRNLTTEKLAELVGVKPESVRRGYCVNGHYLGLVPVKLLNGRLLWTIQ
jgi:hypothetical protein